MSDYRILITGSRDWVDENRIYLAIVGYLNANAVPWAPNDLVVVHGGQRGADTIAGDLATNWGMRVEVYRADWRTYRNAAGPRRNALMVSLGANVCLAFPIGESKGTRGCVKLAEKAGIPVVVHEGASP